MGHFNLKQYLIENKLTYNSNNLSKINENVADYYDDAWVKYVKRSGITGIIDELVKDFNIEFKIQPSKGLEVTPPSSKAWTRFDGSRYKDPGSIDGPDVTKFWEWLQNKPNVKPIGKVGGAFQNDPKMDSIKYKNIYLSKRSSDHITFGSMSRLKSGGGAWNKGGAWDTTQ